MKKTMLKTLALAIIFSVWLAGCSSQPSIKDMTVRIGDNTGDLKITTMRSVVKNGLLSVQAGVKNRGDNDQLAYRFAWYSKAGLRLNEEAWKPLPLSEGHSTQILGVAPTPEADSFKLEVSSP